MLPIEVAEPFRPPADAGGMERCPGGALCSRCFASRAHGGPCAGCDDAYRARCLKGECGLRCDGCSGGRHARTAGCCGRSRLLSADWHRRLRELLATEVPEYAPPPLAVRCRLVPVLYGQLRKYRIPERFPAIDAWATPIHKVASRGGRFRSRDLKDYLGLPADRKLILSTCAPDDFQEMLWRRGPELRYAEHGIDHWFPGHFSIYDGDAKLYQLVSAKRQLLHAVWTQSRFVWFRLGDAVPLQMLAPVRGASSVLFSSQQTFRRRHLRAAYAEIAVADRWFPPGAAFFVVGGCARLPVAPGRVCYRVNSRWQLLALKGRDLANRPAPGLPIDELLAGNLGEVLAQVEGEA
jgi:hypothetical protein